MTDNQQPSNGVEDWALEKREWLDSVDSVHERYGAAGVRELFSTHPPLEVRIRALESSL